MAQNDKTNSAMPIQFARNAGGETYQLVGNRVQIEDALGNLLNMASGLVVSSPTLAALLTQIAALLSGTLTTAATITGLPLQPNVFKSIAAIDISSEATLWTPTSGKKFRLMGGLLTVIGAVGNVVLKDGNSGATVLTLPNSIVGTPMPFNLGDGILSTTINNNLRGLGTTLQVINGTVWGLES